MTNRSNGRHHHRHQHTSLSFRDVVKKTVEITHAKIRFRFQWNVECKNTANFGKTEKVTPYSILSDNDNKSVVASL